MGRLFTVAAVLGLSTSALAAMKPDPMLGDAFTKLVGKWKCTGKASMVPGEVMQPIKSTFKVARELDGFVYVIDVDRPKTKKTPAVKTKMTIGYDPQRKLMLLTAYDTFAGLGEGKAGSIQGDVVTVELDYSTGATMVKQRFLLTRAKDKELALVLEVETDDGWKRLVEESCKK